MIQGDVPVIGRWVRGVWPGTAHVSDSRLIPVLKSFLLTMRNRIESSLSGLRLQVNRGEQGSEQRGNTGAHRWRSRVLDEIDVPIHVKHVRSARNVIEIFRGS